MFDEEPEGLKALVYYIWSELGSLSQEKDYENNLKYTGDAEIVHQKKDQTDEKTYSGQVNDEEIPHGFGRKYLRGAIYEGQFVNGEKDGWGRVIYANGTYYVGFFKNDMIDGKGKMAVCKLNMG